MSTENRAASKRLIELHDGACGPLWADSKISSDGPALPARVLAMCKKRDLEASELIEALRGKRSDPLSEAADALLVLMSITENAGIDWSAVVKQTAATCSRLEGCDQYPGEERMDTDRKPPTAPLPADYIDTEHQGDDRELLQLFYGACNAEGGTADEIHLRGIRAVLAARPAASPPPEHGKVVEVVKWLDIRAALDAAEQHATAEVWANHPLAIILEALIKQARAALKAEPAGQGPPAVMTSALLHPAYEPGDGSADGAQMVDMAWWHPVMGCDSLQIVVDNARNILRSRWARPATQLQQQAAPTPAVVVPVAVGELPWEREDWLDKRGQCWMGRGFITSWRLCRPEDAPHMTHSLPHHAIPLPQAGEGES